MPNLTDALDPAAQPLAAQPLADRPAADRSRPKSARRAPGRARIEQILDAADAMIARQGAVAIRLTAVAAEAKAPVSSVYHFFPSEEALLTALLQRYHTRLDEHLDEPLVELGVVTGWPAAVEALMRHARRFHDQYPVYTDLLLRAPGFPALRQADDVNIIRAGERFAAALEAAFDMPPSPDLPAQLALAVVIADRIWGFAPLGVGPAPRQRISDFAFDESVKAVTGYLANYLPQDLSPKARPA